MLESIGTSDVFSLLIGLFIAAVAVQLMSRTKRTTRKYRRTRQSGFRRDMRSVQSAGQGETNTPDAADQLRRVMEAEFKPRPLLNKSEAAVFKALDAAVIARNPGWQVMAQVSLGEFLSSPDKSAFFSVNSKRVDFALMDEHANVRHALEYQGTGHHVPGGAAAARDAVKKEALRKAGIGYHEVVAGHTTPAELKRLVEKLVPAA